MTIMIVMNIICNVVTDVHMFSEQLAMVMMMVCFIILTDDC